MTATPAGYRRTGLCPTFARPVLQRDGYLLRLPLVGGLLDARQVNTVASVAERYGSGTIELTNRGNLQLRGLVADRLSSALEACVEVGLGDGSASLMTISPFAGPAEHALRHALLEALNGVDLSRLSPKFAAHVDDREGYTADRGSDVLVQPGGDGRCALTVRGIGTAVCSDSNAAARTVRCLVEWCIATGPQTRTADLVAREGAQSLARTLLGSVDWQPPRRRPVRVPMEVRIGLQHAPLDQPVALAGARFGRIDARTLLEVGKLVSRESNVSVRVTPWRSLAFICDSAAQAERVLGAAGQLGLLVDASDPSLGVVTCIGARGCWQTELDTLAEADRFVADRRADLPASAIVHVSGCDKRCATRGEVALTLLGRTDQTGFDELWAVLE